MFTATDNSRIAIARADELIAAIQAEFAVSERLCRKVGETLCAAASAHLRTCLLHHRLAKSASERDRWWHEQLYAMTRAPHSDSKAR